MKTTDTPRSLCLRCGDAFERATADGRPPQGGDVAMCLTCGCLHVFNDDLTVRAPTRDEMRVLARDPQVRHWTAAHAAFRAQRRRH